MDQLPQLVETLRVLARTNEPNRAALVEKAIDEYLNDKAGFVRLSLERLCNAIEREEADRRFYEQSAGAVARSLANAAVSNAIYTEGLEVAARQQSQKRFADDVPSATSPVSRARPHAGIWILLRMRTACLSLWMAR